MLTVVDRLMQIVEPDVVVFGAKDAQQVFIVRKLIGAKYKNCRLIEGPTLREPSGLAMSSRNRYLTEEQREEATKLYKNLKLLRENLERTPVSLAIAQAATAIEASGQTKLEYLAVIDPQIFRPVSDQFHGKAKAIVAARVGEVRLIDNLDLNL
jgi:pantoate--beta-alanine ligase